MKLYSGATLWVLGGAVCQNSLCYAPLNLALIKVELEKTIQSNIPLFKNKPIAKSLNDRIMIFWKIDHLRTPFDNRVRWERSIEVPMMKINQGNTRSATVKPKNQDIFDIRMVLTKFHE